MKKLFSLLMASAVIVFAGCGTSGGDAKNVADKFMDAYLNKIDAQEMIKYTIGEATETVREEFLLPLETSPEIYEVMTSFMTNMNMKYSYNSSKSRMNNVEASLYYNITYSYAGKDGKGTMELEMIEINGKWFIKDFDIDGLKPEGVMPD